MEYNFIQSYLEKMVCHFFKIFKNMNLSNRLIPCLKINSNKELICTENFERHFYIGDPLNAICIFNDFKVDELIIIDIDASKQNRLFDREYLSKISEEFQYPLVVGGGVSSLEDIEILLNSGADRVLISKLMHL